MRVVRCRVLVEGVVVDVGVESAGREMGRWRFEGGDGWHSGGF
jgi:hypothetical protein